jgi:hypothetical protein
MSDEIIIKTEVVNKRNFNDREKQIYQAGFDKGFEIGQNVKIRENIWTRAIILAVVMTGFIVSFLI